MKIIRVTIGSTTSYNKITVQDDLSLSKCLADNNIATAGCTVQLNGAPITGAGLNKSFADLDAGDEPTLMAVVNSKNA